MRDTDQQLSIAKFPHKNDEIDAVRWEAVALTLAERAGIEVPEWSLQMVNDRPVLLLKRFDREAGNRVPFVSAMSMLGADDRDARSYLELVDILRQHGATPEDDMHALWRRIVFSSRIVNDHRSRRPHRLLRVGPQRRAVF